MTETSIASAIADELAILRRQRIGALEERLLGTSLGDRIEALLVEIAIDLVKLRQRRAAEAKAAKAAA